MTDDAGISSPATPAQTDSAPLAAKIVCPKCDAELRNVDFVAGQKLNCLNCGAKFFPPVALDQSQAIAAAKSPTPTAPPKSPGYWLLRLMAGAAIALAAGVCFLVHADSSGPRQMQALSYAAALPLAAIIIFQIVSAFGRLDQLNTNTAWRAGVLPQGLSLPRESSLLYILPLGVAGGLLPLIILATAHFELSAALFSLSGGALLFVVGLALDDLRQFLSRQEQLAVQILRFKQAPPSALGAGVRWTAIFLGMLLLGYVFLIFNMDGGGSVDFTTGFAGVVLLALMIPVCQLALRFENTVHLWSRAAAQFDFYQPPVSPLVNGLCWPPILFLAAGALWLLAYAGRRYIAAREFWLLLSLCLIFTGAALSLLVLLKRTYRWRACHAAVCRGLNPALAAPSRPSSLLLIGLTLSLVALQFWFFVQMILGAMGFMRNLEDVLPLVMVVLSAHYPLLWLLGFNLQIASAAGLRAPESSSSDGQ